MSWAGNQGRAVAAAESKHSICGSPLALARVAVVCGAACLLLCRGEQQPEYRKLYRSSAPELKLGKIYWGHELGEERRRREAEQIMGQMRKLMAMVEERDLSRLPELVSREKGLWVDLKAHRSYAELRAEVRRKDGYLQKFFLDSEKLRLHTGDERSLAVRDVLRYTDTVRADLYLEGDGSCELRLFLEQYPAYNYHLNNPVFVREKDGWKLYRLL